MVVKKTAALFRLPQFQKHVVDEWAQKHLYGIKQYAFQTIIIQANNHWMHG